MSAPAALIFCLFEIGWTGGKRRRLLRIAAGLALLYLILAVLLFVLGIALS